MNYLSKLALRRPVSIMLVVLALLVFGVSAMVTTPLELVPDIEMPMLMVMTIYPNAAPQDVQNLVTEKIEKAASSLPGVKNVQTSSSENMSMVMLELNYGTNMEEARSDLRANIEMYSSSLPVGVRTPTILEMRMDMMATIGISATTKGDIDLVSYIEDYVKPELDKIDGIATVDISGGQRDYISVELKSEALAQYGLDMNTISQIVGAANFSYPAGTVSQGEVDLTLRGGVEYTSAESLRNIPITLRSGDIIPLSDVANVYQSTEASDSISRTNGVDNVTVSVTKRQSASTFSITNAVKSVVDKLNSQNTGVQYTVVFDSSVMIWSTISSVIQTMAYGIILAMIVLFIFFGDWRASLIVGSSIPISLLVTLAAMQLMNFSFNMLSLGGLVIGIGMMVDNSIVVLESCFRSKSSQSTFRSAALQGTKAVANSILASTITTVVVFLPIPFIKGLVGQMFSELCFTIVFSLVASLLSAITIVPLVFYRIAPVERENTLAGKFMSKVEGIYADFLPKSLKRKKTVVFVAIALLVISIAMIPFIGVELFAATDEGTITLNIETRPGLNTESVNDKLLALEEIVSVHPDVDRYSSSSGGTGIMGTSSANVTAYLKKDRAMTTSDVIDQWREESKSIPNCEVVVSSNSTTAQFSGGGGVDIPVQGINYADLEKAAIQVEEMIRLNPDVIRVSSSVSSGNPQAEIVIDPVLSGAVGLSPKQVMGMVYSTMEGTEAFTLTRGSKDYSVRVEYPKNTYKTISDLASLPIRTGIGSTVLLSDISSTKYSNSPQSITKLNGSYLVTVSAQPSSNANTKLNSQLLEQAKQLDLPDTVTVGMSSAMQSQQEEFGTLVKAIFIAIFLVFMVMAMQFESPKFSLVVMLCVPFAMIGSFGALLFTGTTLSLPSLMGFLMLVGIVVNNGILFIDTTNRLKIEESIPAQEALAKAGVMRMRPIFMTTLTTILAMIPMALGVGENGALMQGMALVIIGGLVASTILALLLLPSFYMIMSKPRSKKIRFFNSLKPKN